jgi:hypothetical protein
METESDGRFASEYSSLLLLLLVVSDGAVKKPGLEGRLTFRALSNAETICWNSWRPTTSYTTHSPRDLLSRCSAFVCTGAHCGNPPHKREDKSNEVSELHHRRWTVHRSVVVCVWNLPLALAFFAFTEWINPSQSSSRLDFSGNSSFAQKKIQWQPEDYYYKQGDMADIQYPQSRKKKNTLHDLYREKRKKQKKRKTTQWLTYIPALANFAFL